MTKYTCTQEKVFRKSDKWNQRKQKLQTKHSTYRFSVGVYRRAKNDITFEICVSCIILSTPQSTTTSVQILQGEKKKEEEEE